MGQTENIWFLMVYVRRKKNWSQNLESNVYFPCIKRSTEQQSISRPLKNKEMNLGLEQAIWGDTDSVKGKNALGRGAGG